MLISFIARFLSPGTPKSPWAAPVSISLRLGVCSFPLRPCVTLSLSPERKMLRVPLRQFLEAFGRECQMPLPYVVATEVSM